MATLPRWLDARELALRIASSAILLPSVLVLLWLGGWFSVALFALLGGLMGFEFLRLVWPEGKFVRILAVLSATAIPVIHYGLSISEAWGLAALVVLWVAVDGIVRGRAVPVVAFIGMAMVFLVLLSVGWLRAALPDGRETILWLCVVIAATDVAAYCCGRLIGGPRIAPRVSPNKTWAGLIGGVAAAGLVSAAAVQFSTSIGIREIVAAGMIFALVAQVGDFLESAVKRQSGVKDTGGLIPGHGGVLDRVDGYITAIPVAALWVLLRGGGPFAP